MNGWSIAAIVVSILGLTLTIVIHMLKTTWYMSRLATLLETMTKCVEEIEKRIMTFEANHIKKDDALRDFGRLEASIAKAHSRIDEMQIK